MMICCDYIVMMTWCDVNVRSPFEELAADML